MNDSSTRDPVGYFAALRDEQDAYDDALAAIRAERASGRITVAEAAAERAGLLGAHQERLTRLRAQYLLDEDPGSDDEPYCTACGATIGHFLGHGDGWHHFTGQGTAASPVKLYDAGHAPAVAWRPAGQPGGEG